MTLNWYVLDRNQGQIVEISQPQISGSAEGEEGPGEGLRLRFDQSDQTWTISDRQLGTIAEGTGYPVPTVEEAIRIRSKKQ